jgi:DNA-binding CsgD family transcriptional regulator
MSDPPGPRLALREAILRFDPDDGRWLGRIVRCAAAALGCGQGAIACQVSAAEDGRCVLHTFRSSGVPRRMIPRWLATAAVRSAGEAARATVGDDDRRALLVPTPPATTLGRIAARTGGGASLLRGERDALVIRGTTPDGRRGVLLVAFHPKAIRLSGRRQCMLDRLGAELATACRLRATLSGRDPFALAATALSPLGQTLERRSVPVVGRRATPQAAAELWLELLGGRWCAIDHRDRDGKRWLLAVAKPPDGAAPFELGPDEREVLLRTAARQPLKRIASELGLGASTVSALLRSALRKLRLASPSEAIRIFSAGLADGVGAPDTPRAAAPPARR